MRHNFSVYFFPYYLSASGRGAAADALPSRLLRHGSFLPQAILQLAFALKLGRRRGSVTLCFCLQVRLAVRRRPRRALQTP